MRGLWTLSKRCASISRMRTVLLAIIFVGLVNWFVAQKIVFKHSFWKADMPRRVKSTLEFDSKQGESTLKNISISLEGQIFIAKSAVKNGNELFLRLQGLRDKGGERKSLKFGKNKENRNIQDKKVRRFNANVNVGVVSFTQEKTNGGFNFRTETRRKRNTLKFFPKYPRNTTQALKAAERSNEKMTKTPFDENNSQGNVKEKKTVSHAASQNKNVKLKVQLRHSNSVQTQVHEERDEEFKDSQPKHNKAENVRDQERNSSETQPGNSIISNKAKDDQDMGESRDNRSEGECPINTLSQQGLPDYGKCQPHRPSQEACKMAYNLYNRNPVDLNCKYAHRGDICTLDVSVAGGKKRPLVNCRRNLCAREIVAKSMNPKSGAHDIVNEFSTVASLQEGLVNILQDNIRNGFHYVIIECKNTVNHTLRQLLPINASLTVQDNSSERSKNAINVNIVLIDSVARAHFYRSLPNTIKLLKNWSQDKNAPAHVFDFELFQAVEGHTAENTHALFTGKLFPPKKGSDGARAVDMGHLFGAFKRAGYQTIWQEDLCWKGYWGLLLDLAIGYNWEDLAEALQKQFIDHTGITHSACEVLQTYGLDTPFNGPDGEQICYNGNFQHSYYLNYTLDTLRAIRTSPKASPLLSYLALNVGHDNLGRRIQTFDRALKEYITTIGREQDTMTVILADHGNTYTDYTVSIMEGRFEMFHPSLFVIVPNKVASLLGERAMSALRTNQRRLTTVIDLHHTFMALAGPITNGVGADGVFGPISDTRTCNDLELRTPNLCVCQGWDSPTTNDTLKTALVEFAMGQLNNKLQQEFLKAAQGGSLPLLRSCAKLSAKQFYNVRERNAQLDGSLLTTIDISVPSGNIVSHAEDIFQVEVKSKIIPDQNSMSLELVHYERISMFGKYRACADKGVNPKLCICSRTNNRSSNRSRDSQAIDGSSRRELKRALIKSTLYFCNSKTSYRRIRPSRCLYLLRRTHGKEKDEDALSWEVANVCANTVFVVSVEYSEVQNMKLSSASPVVVSLPPGSVMFVLSAMKSVSYYSGQVTVDVKIVKQE